MPVYKRMIKNLDLTKLHSGTFLDFFIKGLFVLYAMLGLGSGLSHLACSRLQKLILMCGDLEN